MISAGRQAPGIVQLISMLAAILALGGCTPTAPPSGPEVIAAMPLEERWIIVNYWAIWCGPCRDEIPELNAYARERADRVAVYAVNFDDKRGQELLEQATELGIQFPLLREDPGPQFGYVRPTVLPTTLIINPAGELVTRLIGPQTGSSLDTELDLAMSTQQ